MSPVTALLAGTAAPPAYTSSSSSAAAQRQALPCRVGFPLPGGALSVVECSSRPQKKGTKHHMKTRPKKTARWDMKRRPTQYPPLPALPADWTLVAAGATVDADADAVEEAPAPALELAAAVAPAASD